MYHFLVTVFYVPPLLFVPVQMIHTHHPKNRRLFTIKNVFIFIRFHFQFRDVLGARLSFHFFYVFFPV